MPLTRFVPQPIREALASIGTIGTLLTDPTAREIVRTGKMPRGITPEQAARAEERTLSPFRALGFTPEETTTFMGQRPLAAGAKTGLGLASFFVPGGGATVGQALGRGLLSGALYGAGVAKPGEEIPGAITGGLAGGVTGGALYGLGRGIRGIRERLPEVPVAAPLRKYSRQRMANAIKRNVGIKPPANQIMDDAINFSRQYNIPINDEEGLVDISRQLLGEFGGTVDDLAAEATRQGKHINYNAIFKNLEKFKKNQVLSDRKVVDRVIGDLQNLIEERGDDILSSVQIKRILGSKGKWKSPWQVQSPVATKAYENIYKDISNQLAKENLLGNSFRIANRGVEAGLNLRKWAQKAAEKAGTSATLSDPLQDIILAGALIKGGPGALAGAAVGKFVQSPRFEELLARGAGTTADILERTGGAGMPQLGTAGAGLGQLLGYAGPRAAAAAAVPRRAEELQAAGVTPQEAAGILQEEWGMTPDVLGELLGGAVQPTPTMGAGMQPTMGAALPGMLTQMEAQGMSPSEAAQILRQQGITEQDIIGATQQITPTAGMGPLGLSPSQTADLQKLQYMQEMGWSPKELRPMVADILFRQEEISPEIGAYAQAAGQGLIETKEIPAEIRGQVLGYMQQLGITPPLVEKEKKFAEKEIALKEASSSAQVALDLLEKGVSTGPLATRMQQLGEKVGIVGAGTDYRSALALMNTALGNFFLGATIPEHEERRIVNLLPRPTDQEAVAKKKLEMIVKQLRKYE